MKRLYGLAILPLLASCTQKQVDFAPLWSVTRIEARTMNVPPKYGEITKTISDESHIARIVALVDAQRLGWQKLPDSPQVSGLDVALTFASSNGELRRFTGAIKHGDAGGEWNQSAFDSAASGAQWVFKKVPDTQVKALLKTIGATKSPESKM
jgi:hypothetical protein